MRIVVVGASLAGVRTVEGLRRRGSDADVVLVGAEPGPAGGIWGDGIAADRPPLSKAFLADAAVEARPLTDRAGLGALGVELVTGRAVDLDLDRRRVGLHGGESVAFDSLVVATGSTPRSVPGLEPRPGVWTLRTAADATAIRAACPEGARVVVVGGGFIGAEVAWTLRQRGLSVSLVEPLPALMVRGLGQELGAEFTRRHAAAGVDLHLGAGVAAIEGADRVTGVRLTDGTLLPADAVVLGLGTAPETGWLTGAGLDLRDGVVCDERLAAAGAEGVWAVGDVARWRHPREGEDVRVEHWTNAVETAGVVAANLTGTPTVHDAVPYVWTDQLGARLQVFGRVRPQDELRVVVGDLGDTFVALTGGDGLLRSVVGFGAVKALLPFRKLLLAGAGWDEALSAA
jgi:3-phenylpropionate/trans-cinnamate dioxygenase ferredoxin reductase subunit